MRKTPPQHTTQRKPLIRRALLLGLMTLVLSGCFTTHLTDSAAVPELDSLVESAQVHIPLYVSNPLEGSSHGYQFLLFVLPITRVFPDELQQLVTTKVTTHAGFAGYGLLSRLPAGTPLPRLEVSIEAASVNGYDLLVTRRPSASVTLRGRLFTRDATTRDCETSGSHSEFSRFAFARDLQAALERAVDAASKELVLCLGLTARHGTSASQSMGDVL